MSRTRILCPKCMVALAWCECALGRTPTHIHAAGKSAPHVQRHPDQIEREKQQSAYYMAVVWPEIAEDCAAMVEEGRP